MTNDTQEYRHQCEVRVYLRERSQKGKEGLRKMLNHPKLPATRREKLIKDIWDQWTLGNKGEDGVWILKKSLLEQQELDIFA
jgi:hypothetical protein